MSRADEVRQAVDHINARDFDSDLERYAEGLKFHAPGLGVDVEGRDAAMDVIRRFVTDADVRHELEDVVEHGPFAVAFIRSTGLVDGDRKSWDLCQVVRYEGDEVAEIWALRGSRPEPAGRG